MEGLRELPDESVHCCVTSPPYWGLRDYKIKPQIWDDPGDCTHEWSTDTIEARTGTGGNWQQAANGVALRTGKDQTRFKGDCTEANKCEIVDVETAFCLKCGAWLGSLGLEPTPELYVKHMVDVFREVWRVLRDDGTVWLNLGDSYAGGGRGGNPEDSIYQKQATNYGSSVLPSPIPDNLKPKDLVGAPWMVAFALRADGWYLRQNIIWNKPNPMPESVKDRCTKAQEDIFLLAKKPRYFYDATAIREPASYGDDEARYSRARNGHKSNPDDLRNGIRPRSWKGSGFDVGKTAAVKNEGFRKVPSNWDTEPGTHGSFHRDGRAKKKSGNKERKPGSARGCPEGTGSNVCGSVPWEGDTRNKRSVWTVPTKPFKEAHFATFPEELIEPCILAGTSAQGCCALCGAPLVRLTETQYRKHENYYGDKQKVRNSRGEAGTAYNEPVATRTTGWASSCDCETGKIVPCTVLDPFAGAGTTGVVAARGYRNFIGFEINPEYCEMAQNRIEAITRQGRLFEPANLTQPYT